MNVVLLVMSICSFLLGMLGVFAKWTGKGFVIFMAKIISLFALLTPIIYWLQLLNVIN